MVLSVARTVFPTTYESWTVGVTHRFNELISAVQRSDTSMRSVCGHTTTSLAAAT